jgi:serine/threonine protein kinase/tetratricopeptide (TPR) repeat protein
MEFSSAIAEERSSLLERVGSRPDDDKRVTFGLRSSPPALGRTQRFQPAKLRPGVIAIRKSPMRDREFLNEKSVLLPDCVQGFYLQWIDPLLMSLLHNPISLDLENQSDNCPQCGSPLRVGRSLCLNCLLVAGVDGNGDQSQSDETHDDLLGEVDVFDADWRIGNYQILGEIGHGGMGVIYKARQRHSRRIVALKRILTQHSDSRETLARFLHEAQAAASLDHPNILPIYEVGECDDGLPFISMKLACSGSLRDAAALWSEPRRAVGLVVKLARAVQHAHEHGLLHRDLKPGNVLLDGRGEPLVSDFGLSKWFDATTHLTPTLTVFGTPGYVAPEQVNGSARNLTPAADIYSLGSILFDLLTGRPPFLGENALQVIQHASEKPAPKLRTLVPMLDRDLETICAKCLEREPGARYRSANALAEDLERWLQSRPIVARPVSPPVRLWRWSRRNPVIAQLATLLLALGIAVGVLIWNTKMASPLGASGIAIVPFESSGAEKENAFFADGVYDGVSTKLAKVANLKVISHNSVAKYRGNHNAEEIGRALNVVYVLKGRVRREAGKIHLSAKLIDTRTGADVWAREYDRDLGDVFTLQSEIAQKVADRLQAGVSPTEKSAMQEVPTTDFIAYDAYLRAKDLISGISFSARAKEDLFQAVQLLDQAVARDPSFFEAYCQLAGAHDRIYFLGFDHTNARLKLSEIAIQFIRRLRPGSGETHLALAHNHYWAYRDYDRAKQELVLAGRTLPNESRIPLLAGYIDRRQGRWEKSLEEMKQALQLNPRDFSILQQISLTYGALRRYKDMAATLDTVLAIAPKDIPSRVRRAWVDFDERADPKPLHTVIDTILTEDASASPVFVSQWLFLALHERDPIAAQRALSVMPADGGGCFDENIPFPDSWCEGLVAWLRGDQSTARAAFNSARTKLDQTVRSQPDYAAAFCALGVVDAVLGNKKDAIREGEHALKLLPVGENAVEGATLVRYLAVIYAWADEKDCAIERVAETTHQPGSHVSYGYLRLNPLWDPLRGDPRFEAIVASLAPK